MARYGEAFRNRAVARLLPPESANVGAVAKEIGVSVQTLERWREEAQSATQHRMQFNFGHLRVYLARVATAALRGHEKPVDDALLQYLSPLGGSTLNLTGDYLWRRSAKIGAGKFRPLRPLPPPWRTLNCVF